jgi:hypothetical protein
VPVTFPAASTIFPDADRYGLSNAQCGYLFLPQMAPPARADIPPKGGMDRRAGTI